MDDIDLHRLIEGASGTVSNDKEEWQRIVDNIYEECVKSYNQETGGMPEVVMLGMDITSLEEYEQAKETMPERVLAPVVDADISKGQAAKVFTIIDKIPAQYLADFFQTPTAVLALHAKYDIVGLIVIANDGTGVSIGASISNMVYYRKDMLNGDTYRRVWKTAESKAPDLDEFVDEFGSHVALGSFFALNIALEVKHKHEEFWAMVLSLLEDYGRLVTGNDDDE